MKVLLINSVCKNGSTGKIVYSLYSQILANGDEAAICYGRGQQIKEKNIYRFAPQLEVYLHAFLTRITGLTGYFSPIATYRLIRFIKEYKPDVVHIHELHAYFVNHLAVMKYLKREKIKTVWTFHCEYMYTGKCGYALECENWKTECSKCPNLKEYPKSLFLGFTKKMFIDKKKAFDMWSNLTIVTPSKWLANRVRQSFLKSVPIHVIHNGIDTDTIFFPHPYEHLKQKHGLTDEKIILAVAPDLMSRRKGGQFVLQLAEILHNENIKFILIGVSNLSENFPDNVIALGRTENQTELAEYYSMADVFVICSERENFPTTCLEALCCGTCVCGFNTGGTYETVPKPWGNFIEYGDVNTLAEVIFKMVNIKFSEKTLLDYGQEHYSHEKMFHKYIEFYQQ